MAEKGGQNEQRTPPLEALEVDDGADTSQSDKFTVKVFLTKAVLLVITELIKVVLCLAFALGAFIVILFWYTVMTCFAGHVCILYGLYFRGKEEKLRKEYVDAGIGLEGFVVSCVSAKYDKSGALYDSTIQYAAPDNTACYALTIHSGRKKYHVNEQVQIVVLFGIPQSGRLASACESSDSYFGILCFSLVFGSFWAPIMSIALFGIPQSGSVASACESSDSYCGIRCFSLVFGSFWAPLMSTMLAGMIINLGMSNMDIHVTLLTVFCVMLVIPFPVMVFLFSRRMMTQQAKVLPHDQVSSVLLDTLATLYQRDLSINK